MSATKTQIIGGAFQDSEGNILANGYLILKLNQDENVSGVGNLCAGITITLQLDSAGNVASSSSTPPVADQYVFANDVMTPTNSYYRVTGYSAQGQVAWGPNNQQITSGGTGGGTFNASTWVPNTVFSWSPATQPVTFQVAGVPLSSQTLVDFVNTGSVIFTDEGGGEISASAGGNASDWFTPCQDFGGVSGVGNVTFVDSISEDGGPGSGVQISLDTPVTIHKISVNIAGIDAGKSIVVAIYTADGSTKLVDAGTSAFNSNSLGVQTVTLGSPVKLQPGCYTVAWQSTGGSTNPQTFGLQSANSPLGSAGFVELINANANRYGRWSLNTSGVTMPSTLGAFEPPASDSQNFNIPCFLFE